MVVQARLQPNHYPAVRLGVHVVQIRKTFGFVTALLASVGLLGLVGDPQALAAVGCASNYGSLFDGYLSTAAGPGGTYEGALAYITVEPAVVCDTGGGPPPPGGVNFVYTWTMIHQNNAAPGGSGAGYAQIWYMQQASQCAYYTSEYSSGASDTFHRHIFTERGCLLAGVQHRFWEQYVPSTGELSLNVDITPFTVTPFSPYASWSPGIYGPFYTEFDAESKYLGSNVPSTSYSGMQVQQFDDAWTNVLPTYFDSCPWPARYTHGAVISRGFPIDTVGGSSAYNC